MSTRVYVELATQQLLYEYKYKHPNKAVKMIYSFW